jgi:hypothetical protein
LRAIVRISPIHLVFEKWGNAPIRDDIVGDRYVRYDVAASNGALCKMLQHINAGVKQSRRAMEMPCPPEHVLPVNTTFEPELIAMQSSWFLTVLPARISHNKHKMTRHGGPGLDRDRRLVADVESICVAPSCSAVALRVWLVTGGYFFCVKTTQRPSDKNIQLSIVKLDMTRAAELSMLYT